MRESELEKLALTWFQDSGWEYRHGPDLAPDGDTPERTDYRQVLFQDRMHEALRQLKPELPDPVLKEALHRIAKLLAGELLVSTTEKTKEVVA